MNLKEIVTSLDEQTQYKIALIFTQKALVIWDDYTKDKNIAYVDSVVGINHTVDSSILKRTLQVINRELKTPKSQGKNIKKLQGEYSDPIVALQDFDWELPKEVRLTFYSIKNLLAKISAQNTSSFNESLLYVVINQAIDAIYTAKIMTIDEVKSIFDTREIKKESRFFKNYFRDSDYSISPIVVGIIRWFIKKTKAVMKKINLKSPKNGL